MKYLPFFSTLSIICETSSLISLIASTSTGTILTWWPSAFCCPEGLYYPNGRILSIQHMADGLQRLYVTKEKSDIPSENPAVYFVWISGCKCIKHRESCLLDSSCICLLWYIWKFKKDPDPKRGGETTRLAKQSLWRCYVKLKGNFFVAHG